MVNPSGPDAPVANGDPATSVKLPLAESIEKAETDFVERIPHVEELPVGAHSHADSRDIPGWKRL